MFHFEFLLHQVQLFDFVRHVVIYRVHAQKPHNGVSHSSPTRKKKKNTKEEFVLL